MKNNISLLLSLSAVPAVLCIANAYAGDPTSTVINYNSQSQQVTFDASPSAMTKFADSLDKNFGPVSYVILHAINQNSFLIQNGQQKSLKLSHINPGSQVKYTYTIGNTKTPAVQYDINDNGQPFVFVAKPSGGLQPPTNISAQPGNNDIALSWNNESSINFYQVDYRVSNQGAWKLVDKQIRTNSFDVNDLSANTHYDLRVKSCLTQDKCSDWSNPVSATTGGSPTPPTSNCPEGNLPLVVKNNSGKKAYFILPSAQHDVTGMININSPGFTNVTAINNLHDFEGVVNNKGHKTFCVPKNTSGRMYISLGQSLITNHDFYFNADHKSFGAPTADAKSLYDKIEFTNNDSGSWVNPTSVDFFALPITISQNNITSGLSEPRDMVVQRMDNLFAMDLKTQPIWLSLQSNLRVLAPKNGFKTQAILPNNIADIWQFYKTHPLKVDLNELMGNNTVTKQILQATGPIAVGQVTADNNLMFTINYKPGFSVGFKIPNDPDQFFSGAGLVSAGSIPNTATVDEKKAMAKIFATLQRDITAAYDAGLLPADTNATLGGNYFKSKKMQKVFYKLTKQNHPIYDVYSKAIHSFGENTYGFAYDDVLGQDGTLTSGSANINHNPVTVVLHPLVSTKADLMPVDTQLVTSSNSGDQLTIKAPLPKGPKSAGTVTRLSLSYTDQTGSQTADIPGQCNNSSCYWTIKANAPMLTTSDDYTMLMTSTSGAIHGSPRPVKVLVPQSVLKDYGFYSLTMGANDVYYPTGELNPTIPLKLNQKISFKIQNINTKKIFTCTLTTSGTHENPTHGADGGCGINAGNSQITTGSF